MMLYELLHTADMIKNLYMRSPYYHVLSDDELQHLKDTMCEIADDFVSCCDRNDLQYTMAYGTALGAVRHHGFVPWDDDMDFYLPRKDYEKFLQIANKELGEKYYIRSARDGVRIPSCHIRKKGTRYINYGDVISSANDPEEMRGIYIDVFPLDNISDNSVLRFISRELVILNLGIISCISVRQYLKVMSVYGVQPTAEEKRRLLLKRVLGWIFSFFPLEKWYMINDRICSSCKNTTSKYLVCYIYRGRDQSMVLRDTIFPADKGEFEGRTWSMPGNTDKYLSRVYGDYRTLPDEEKRKTHPILQLEF